MKRKQVKFSLKKNRRGKRKSIKKTSHSLTFVGINANGIKSKMGTFKKLIRDAKPSIWSMQETKCQVKGKFKLDEYYIYELLREKSKGGGLAIGALKDLDPVWIKEGNDEVEAITIEIKVKKLAISYTTSYGPQENDKIEKKIGYWDYLNQEVLRANKEGKGFVLQCDSNAWLGSNIIPGDPRPQNKNGKLFAKFLNDNPHLTLINSLPVCEGKITRSRMCEDKLEESILDVYVVCQLVLPYVTKMIVDVDKKYILTNYHNLQRGGKATNTDHVPVILYANLMFSAKKSERIELFDFKDENSQRRFYKNTSETKEFTNCFKSKNSIKEQVGEWIKVLNKNCKNSFRKIRVREKKLKSSAADDLINERNKLDKIIKKDDSLKNNTLKNDIEHKISKILEQEGRALAYKFKKFSVQSSSADLQEMWKLKKKVWPKNKISAPSAKLNHKMKLISDPKGLKSLIAKEYKERLRRRPVRPDFIKIKRLRNELVKIKLKKARNIKSKEWTMEDLDKVLNSLKKKKSRDPDGLANEIFQNPIIGINLKNSLLIMANKIKQNLMFPRFMKKANVTTIPKGGSRLLLKNERGVFRLSIIRNIVMKLIYNQNSEEIDNNMSDSNIGGRKGRGCRDHIFMINGIIHHQLAKKSKTPLAIQIFDYAQMFDSMSLEEASNDLYDVGVKDDNLLLIYEANQDIEMSVKIQDGGLTEAQQLESVVLQGDTWGPALASNQVDTIGKECEEESKYEFIYKDIVPIPPLGMVDDLVGISEAGYKAQELNAYINVKTADKKLQFGPDKCKVMLVGKTQENFHKNKLFVDCWNIKHDDNDDIIGKFEGKTEMKSVNFDKYLGFVISNNGNNMKNIETLQKKSIGVIKQILTILQNMGKFTFECAFIYMNSILRGSTLYACETYYNLKENEIREIEKIDEDFMRQVFDVQRSCPIPLLYLESGQIPVRFIVQKQKLLYLFDILQRDNETLLFKFFKAQEENPIKGDWTTEVKDLLKSLDLKWSFDDIKILTKQKFKKIIDVAINKSAIKYLKGKIKTKGNEIFYSDYPEIQDYLMPYDSLTLDTKRKMFKFRTRMNLIPANFSSTNWELRCEKPCSENLTNEHIYNCKILNEKEENEIQYKNIFNGTIFEKIKAMNLMNQKYEKMKLKNETFLKKFEQKLNYQVIMG